MPEERNVKKVLKNIPEGKKRSLGRPRKRKRGDVENDLKEMGIRGLQKSYGLIRLETDADGGQGPASAVQPVEKQKYC
jgi:hypothetical protein